MLKQDSFLLDLHMTGFDSCVLHEELYWIIFRLTYLNKNSKHEYLVFYFHSIDDMIEEINNLSKTLKLRSNNKLEKKGVKIVMEFSETLDAKEFLKFCSFKNHSRQWPANKIPCKFISV